MLPKNDIFYFYFIFFILFIYLFIYLFLRWRKENRFDGFLLCNTFPLSNKIALILYKNEELEL